MDCLHLVLPRAGETHNTSNYMLLVTLRAVASNFDYKLWSDYPREYMLSATDIVKLPEIINSSINIPNEHNKCIVHFLQLKVPKLVHMKIIA